MAASNSTRNSPVRLSTYQGTTITSLQEMVECLLWDFAKRAQQEEDRAYRNYRRFIESSELVMEAHQEPRWRVQ